MPKFNPGIMTCAELLAYKHSLFQKYQEEFKLKTFVETGTDSGDAVEAARPFFQNIYSIELGPKRHAVCADRFKSNTNVQIIFGDSEVELERIMDNISTENILFWLDAHAVEGELPAKHAFSGFEEMENLLKRPLKNCVILIDDIQEGLYYDRLMKIAPDAQVEMGVGRVVIP
jgi:hypothetical protein